MGLFRFLHRWPAIIPPDSPLADVVHLLDDRDRELEDHLSYRIIDVSPALTGIPGAVTAGYTQKGREVHFAGEVVASGAVTASILIALPVAASSRLCVGSARAADASATYNRTVGVAEVDVATYGQVVHFASTGNNDWAAAAPFTWANTDLLTWSITYESAE